MTTNSDSKTVAGFGAEWSRFDQSAVDQGVYGGLFQKYFSIFPWDKIGRHAHGFDVGCGSGRWDRFVAPRVGRLHCIDASHEALEVAKRNLAPFTNCEFHLASVGEMPMADASMDFGFSLGVLHHIPNTAAGIEACVRKLKPGAPFLVYLYYRFDNRPNWFRALWRTSDIGRQIVSRLPTGARNFVADAIAATVYFPLARSAKFLEKRGALISNFPLAAYRKLGFYEMRTDALDRFGTRLEQRFTRDEIKTMMVEAGLERVSFSDEMPYWCAVGYKR